MHPRYGTAIAVGRFHEFSGRELEARKSDNQGDWLSVAVKNCGS